MVSLSYRDTEQEGPIKKSDLKVKERRKTAFVFPPELKRGSVRRGTRLEGKNQRYKTADIPRKAGRTCDRTNIKCIQRKGRQALFSCPK